MRFKRLALKNWRSFLGSYEVDFADTGDRNVTIFVGQNGAGKTALLNAFTWSLFGETTAGFRQPDDLFNHAALEAIPVGESARMEVSLEFEHDGHHYVVRRHQQAFRDNAAETPAVEPPILAATRRRVATEKITQHEINAVLPPGLHPFFFFPAENIGKDFDQNDAAAIRASMSNAIDVLLGIERYDKALAVISTALGKHLKTPRGARDSSLDGAEQQMKSARHEWEKKSERKRELPSLITRQETLAEKLKAQLDASEEHRKAMDEYKRVKGDKAAAEERVATSKEDLRGLANQHCALVFGHELFAKAEEVLNEAHRKGEIPPKVSAGLLSELLEERQQCICGRELGEHERSELEALRSRTVEDFVAEIASNLRGRVPRFAWKDEGRRDELAAKLILDEVRKGAEAEAQFRKLRNREMELLNRQPELVSHADRDETMTAWQLAAQGVMKLSTELQNVSNDLPRLKRLKDEAERAYQKQLTKNTAAKTIGRARELLANVESTLSIIQSAIRAAARQDIERAMNGFYSPLLLKDYRISLTEEFRYAITDQGTGRDVGASSSEVALATFAFVGALASLMPEYANLDQLLPRGDDKSVGGIKADPSRAYPVVLDAPYSPFGSDYSARFSEKLPSLLPQSVVIVREDQLQYVEPMLGTGRVGSAYVLRLHSGKEDARRIKWLDHEVDYVVNTDDEEAAHSQLASLPLE